MTETPETKTSIKDKILGWMKDHPVLVGALVGGTLAVATGAISRRVVEPPEELPEIETPQDSSES